MKMEVQSADCALCLSLKDFVCETVACEMGDFENPELVISSAKLCEHFEKALRKHEKAEAKMEKAKNQGRGKRR